MLLLPYSYLPPIKPDEEKKNNWTKVLFATSCRTYRRLSGTAEARASYEKALAPTHQKPERQFLQRRIRQLK
jgi:predicted RNA polymerase sigma factor